MKIVVAIVTLLIAPSAAAGQEWRGYIEGEYRGFTKSPLDPEQHDRYYSLALQPEFYTSWDNGDQALTFTPFYRWDQYDDQRTHGDIRELLWLYSGKTVEWRVGVGKVFWGVIETEHLVDVINQTDLVEDPDGEQKLGQPMVNATLLSDVGVFNIFMLPYFRERTFPGEQGRLRTVPRIDTDTKALYESGKEDHHIDWALRWSRSFRGWDVGLSYFYGTNREPGLVPGVDSKGQPVFVPFYDVINQAGLDLQGAQGAWLWKLEAIRRNGDHEDYWASATGFEYTTYAVFGSAADIGWLMEYLYDSRGREATTTFDNDISVGFRLSLNDAASSELLALAIFDRNVPTKIYNIEASRRLSEHMRMSLKVRLFDKLEPDDPIYSYRRDDYFQIDLTYYF